MKKILFLFFLSLGLNCNLIYNKPNPKPVHSAQSLVVPKDKPQIKIWPDMIEITMKFHSYPKTVYFEDKSIIVTYKYFKKEKTINNVKIQAELRINPLNSQDKLPTEIYLNKNEKVVLVKIWGVGDYECQFNYSQIDSSLCQKAENKYKEFCAPQKMNCHEIVEKILLKEPSEWL